MKLKAIIIAFLLISYAAQGATLNLVSDTLSTSEPGVAANHIIKFTTITAIPVSGTVVITPQSGNFNISSGLDFTDVDLLINNSQKTLAASAGSGSGSAIGISAVSGISGSLTLTLNDSDAISGGSSIIIRIGTNAEFGATGDQQIINPASPGSYRIRVATKNSSNITLDEDDAMAAIVTPVDVSAKRIAPAPSPAPASAPAPSGGGGGGGGGDGGLLPAAPAVPRRVGNLNSDGRIDLIDFSILLFNWGIPKNPATDLNQDGKVDLVDFSIMLYWWTG